MNPNYVRAKTAWLYKMAKRADFFVSVSEYTKIYFLKYFPDIEPDRIKVIPLGVDEQFRVIEKNIVKKKLSERYKIKNPYVLFIGGIEPRKNVKNVIKGFHEISDKYSELSLVLVGGAKNDYLSSLEKMISTLGLDKKIKFIGYVEQGTDDLTLLYNGAECFVYASFSEGWTSPPLEAMACGIPVVASNSSSLPETVGNAALLVNPKSYNEIGAALEKLIIDSDLRKNLIINGLHHVSRFTWKRCAEETYSFYKNIVES
jgi:glycosyltransferase involved in cell wall biosynthesis